MPLVKGTIKTGSPAGGSKVYTLTDAATVPDNPDRFLMFVAAHDPVGYSGAYSITGVTFNGIAMTKKTTLNASGFYETSWGLVDADAGTHDIVVTFTGPSIGLYYGWRWVSCGFSGSSGFGNVATNNYANSPHSISISVSEGSAMYSGGAGTYSVSKITLDTTPYNAGSLDVEGSVYTKNWGGKVGQPGLVAGSRSGKIEGATASYQYTNTTLEIKESEGGALPTVDTGTVENVGRLSADIIDSEVTSDGGDTGTTRGVLWNTTTVPGVGDNTITDPSTGIGQFDSNITGLSPNKEYHAIAYASNGVGTVYGDERTFTTKRRIIIF